MKNLRYILALALFFSFASCEDFLDQTSPDQLNTENFWRNSTDAESALASAYSQLEGFVGWAAFQEARPTIKYFRNDLIQPGSDAFNYAWWVEFHNFTYTPGNHGLTLMWQWNYRGINFANQVIANVPNIPASEIEEADREQIIAEAQFLRAYYHLQLLLDYEQIILRTTAPKGATELAAPLSTRVEAWTFIVEELEMVAKKLPVSHPSNRVGRATKGAALAYLGQASMFRSAEENNNGYLTTAKKAFEDVIALGEYSLETNFNGMFDGMKQNSSESIFELQLSSNKDNGASHDLWFPYFVGASEFGYWEEVLATDKLFATMTKEGKVASTGFYDSRVYGTLVFDDEYYNDVDKKRLFGETFDEWFGAGNKKVSMRKYLPDAKEKMYSRSAINHPLMRYAEVLLLYAEILNSEGDVAGAETIINNIREKHGNMPAVSLSSKDQAFAQIEHERIMEFTLEGKRFHTLRRWGMLEERMQAVGRTGFSGKASYFLPIPENEVNSNSEIQ